MSTHDAAGTGNTALLEVRDLVVGFGTGSMYAPAVKGISFSLKEKETLAIVGESGSGKSITSLAILGLLPANGKVLSGEIVFNSGDRLHLESASEEQMRQVRGRSIAMVFQEPMTSLNPVLTCGSQVAETLITHERISADAARERVLSLFSEVQLPDPSKTFDKYPHELSGGQKQRVMIAMAISCRPALLIADEPTTALDVTVQKGILLLLKELQHKYGMAIIFITHDLCLVDEIADTAMVMHKGTVVESGSVAAMFLEPQHPYTRGLLACRPPMNGRSYRLAVVSDFMSGGPPPQVTMITATEREKEHERIYRGKKLVEVNDVRAWYPVRKGIFSRPSRAFAVNGVSFDVYEGETLGLVGESGCGKSTLGRAILGLNDNVSGSIKYNGTELIGLPEKQMRSLRREMQMVFQDPYSSLNPRISVGDAIAEPMLVHGRFSSRSDARREVRSLLEKVGLPPDYYRRYPHQFSGGQRQRICIARALAVNPRFIVCDESVSALDVSVQAQVLNLLNELKREFNFTYIFISHDLGVVKFMSDRMLVMRKGLIEEMGDPDEVYAHPASAYTRRLIESIPGSEGYRKRD